METVLRQAIVKSRHYTFCLCLEGERSKPPLLLLHELNGLTPETFRYATELSKDFTVYIPMLFGTKGRSRVGAASRLTGLMDL